MASHDGGALGARQPAAVIELPAPCAGTTIPEVAFPCARDAGFVVWGPVTDPETGRPAMAWVFVCRLHVRQARRMLQASTPMPDLVETNSLDHFMEIQALGIFEEEGIQAPQLRRSA